ncbi:MAG TPA: hypothetical protein VK646_04215 [Actinomycetota bacterium]|nr:hypothetical protein [Actinomycetota bacterium]
MTIGPVQLLVLGFPEPERATGEIAKELDRLRETNTIRVVDALVVYKDAEGEVSALEASQLSPEEEVEFGGTVGALIGLGFAGEEGMVAGAEAGAERAAEGGFEVFSGEDAWDVVEDIPTDTAAALILIEHTWAAPLRDAIARAGGFPISDGFIHASDLVAVGMIGAEEAKELEAMEAGPPA